MEGVLCCNCPDCMEGRKLRKVQAKTIEAMAERIAGQSELLSKRAERTSIMADIGMTDEMRAKQDRKKYPVASGCLDYFPDALLAVAHCSYVGNEQHNPGSPLHWDRSKSTDEADALIRHFLQRGTVDDDGIAHSVKVAWRALALLQKEIEQEKAQ